jgi:hypothetical protein
MMRHIASDGDATATKTHDDDVGSDVTSLADVTAMLYTVSLPIVTVMGWWATS